MRKQRNDWGWRPLCPLAYSEKKAPAKSIDMSSREAQVKAFEAFPFDTDRGWLAHRANIELPAGNEAQALRKVQAQWYKRTQVSEPLIS